MEEVCDVRIQKNNAHCNSDSRQSDATIRREERDWRELMREEELIRRKPLNSTLSRWAVWVEPLQMCDAYSIQGRTTPLYRASNWGGVKKYWRRLRTPNLLEACLEREVMWSFHERSREKETLWIFKTAAIEWPKRKLERRSQKKDKYRKREVYKSKPCARLNCLLTIGVLFVPVWSMLHTSGVVPLIQLSWKWWSLGLFALSTLLLLLILSNLFLPVEFSSLSLYYRYYNGHCSSELSRRIPTSLRRARATRLST